MQEKYHPIQEKELQKNLEEGKGFRLNTAVKNRVGQRRKF